MSPALAAILQGAILGTEQSLDDGLPLATQALLLTPFGFVQNTCTMDVSDPDERREAIFELRVLCANYKARGVVLVVPDLPPLAYLLFYVEVHGAAWVSRTSVATDGNGKHHIINATFEDGTDSVFMPLLEFPPGEPVSPAPACAS